MAGRPHAHLSRRESQIMDVIYRRGEATAAEVLGDLPDPPAYSTVRTLLGILEEKGHLVHRKQGVRFVYVPTRPREAAARTALQRVIRTFFASSASDAMAALLDLSGDRLSDAELNRLARLIDQARPARNPGSNPKLGE
jgi:BlaI family transcriptional regulator, penicillinase repressor